MMDRDWGTGNVFLGPRRRRQHERQVETVAIALWAIIQQGGPYPGRDTDVGAEIWLRASEAVGDDG